MVRQRDHMEPDQLKEWVREHIERTVRDDAAGRIRIDGTPFFSTPLIGFVSGDDGLFDRLKEIIGPFHLTPREALSRVAMQRGVEPPEEVGVISYVLPISEATKRENAAMVDAPSERWAHTRLYGEMFNKKLALDLARMLTAEGYFAIAPETEDVFELVKDERVGEASTWSQRHVAYAAGLGAFGLSDGLITPAGVAHRLGSVIVGYPLDSPDRPVDRHRFCLFFRNGSCQVCARRCPAAAISDKGHDKERCASFVYGQRNRVNRDYGIDIYGCGLCQTGVPCESRIPEGLED